MWFRADTGGTFRTVRWCSRDVARENTDPGKPALKLLGLPFIVCFTVLLCSLCSICKVKLRKKIEIYIFNY